MGKALYGKGNAKLRKSAAAADHRGWVTVTASVPEEQLHAMIIAAFADARAPPELAAASDMHTSLAASLIEYSAERNADCDESWHGLVAELCSDMNVSLADPDAVEAGANDDVRLADRAGAEALVACLKRHKVLCAEPPPPLPLIVGCSILAVLEEDGEWHEAVVTEKTDAGGLGRAPRFNVRFVEWAKVQETSRANIVSLAEVADDDAGDGGEKAQSGACELCGRTLQLTFHHLIPKETHTRYLTRGSLPDGVVDAALSKGLEPHPLSREFLHRYGTKLCRFCHTTVHRLAPNAVLAERFNTLEKLAAEEEITKFVAFAALQKMTAH